MGAQSKTSPRRAKTRERMLTALRLRASGATYEAIGDHLGISLQAAHQLVKHALNEFPAEAAEELRALELLRLDRLMLGIWQNASQGNLGAIDRTLRLMERRAKLTGLDAPILSADVSGWTDEELNEYATTGKQPVSSRSRAGTAQAQSDTTQAVGEDSQAAQAV